MNELVALNDVVWLVIQFRIVVIVPVVETALMHVKVLIVVR